MKVFDLVFLTFSFCQMECSLEKLRAHERKISITGESLSQTEQCVRELDSLERRVQVAALCLPVHVVQSVANMQIFLIDCVCFRRRWVWLRFLSCMDISWLLDTTMPWLWLSSAVMNSDISVTPWPLPSILNTTPWHKHKPCCAASKRWANTCTRSNSLFYYEKKKYHTWLLMFF